MTPTVMLPTFSRLPVLAECIGPAYLPLVERPHAAARRGTVLHAFLRDVRALGRDQALARAPDDMREACADWDMTWLPTDPTEFAGEVAFALDLEAGTGRELGRDLDRDYDGAGRLPGELAGACDAFALEILPTVRRGVVWELKTGRRFVPPPLHNLQLRGVALAAALAYDLDEVDLVLCHQREDSSGWTEHARLEALDLLDVRTELRELIGRLARARAGDDRYLREGAWCGVCEAQWDCPARMRLVKQMVAAPASIEQQLVDLLGQGFAAEAYQRVKAARTLVDRLEAVLEEFAEGHPIELGDGRVYGPQERTYRSLKGPVVWEVIRDLLGEDAAWELVEMKATLTKVNTAARRIAAKTGEKIGQVEKRLLEDIRGRDGLKTKVALAVTEHKSSGRDAAEEAA